MDLTQLLDEVERMRQAVQGFPAHWDGRAAILEMRDAGSKHWRQTEWMGWYHEFLCQKHLGAVLDMPGPKYGNSTLDARKTIAWDFKCHAANSTRNDIITNHAEAVMSAIRDYGRYGLVLALGIVEYNDEERTFKKWHQELGGGPSDYTLRRIARGAMSRRRKTEFVLSEIHFRVPRRTAPGRMRRNLPEELPERRRKPTQREGVLGPTETTGRGDSRDGGVPRARSRRVIPAGADRGGPDPGRDRPRSANQAESVSSRAGSKVSVVVKGAGISSSQSTRSSQSRVRLSVHATRTRSLPR